MMSVLLPAGNGTISRIGRSGQGASPVCAAAVPAASIAANAIEMSRIIANPPGVARSQRTCRTNLPRRWRPSLTLWAATASARG